MASVHEMASVHVVGDLLGASGLSSLSGQEAFSVAHVLDLLSLHPSTELSYFCKWRLVVDEPTRSSREKASWKVLQGETHGQTQVHAASSGGSLAMPDLHRHGNRRIALPMMDTVWAHPIELHLATSNADAWKCWPRLEFQVWSLDGFQLETLCGAASISLPLTTNEYVLDVPLVLQGPHTVLGSLTRAVGLPFSDNSSKLNGVSDSDEVIRAAGTLFLRLAVLGRGFQTRAD